MAGETRRAVCVGNGRKIGAVDLWWDAQASDARGAERVAEKERVTPGKRRFSTPLPPPQQQRIVLLLSSSTSVSHRSRRRTCCSVASLEREKKRDRYLGRSGGYALIQRRSYFLATLSRARCCLSDTFNLIRGKRGVSHIKSSKKLTVVDSTIVNNNEIFNLSSKPRRPCFFNCARGEKFNESFHLKFNHRAS